MQTKINEIAKLAKKKEEAVLKENCARLIWYKCNAEVLRLELQLEGAVRRENARRSKIKKVKK